jgi:hypothetical protein
MNHSTGSCYIVQVGLELSNPPDSTSQETGIIGVRHYAWQAILFLGCIAPRSINGSWFI